MLKKNSERNLSLGQGSSRSCTSRGTAFGSRSRRPWLTINLDGGWAQIGAHGLTMSHKVSPAPGNAPTTPDVKETTLGLLKRSAM